MWPKYEEAYQAMLDRTSTDYAPWHVVPCDAGGTAGWRSPSCSSRRSERLDLSWPPADFDVAAEKKRLAEA